MTTQSTFLPQRTRFTDLLTVAVGLLQAALAFSFAFLPVFTSCMGPANSPLDCRRITYGEQGGSAVGYVIFLVMIALGIATAFSTRVAHPAHARTIRWLALAATAVVVVLGAWGVGLLFLPGGLLLLIAALAGRKTTAPA